MPEHNDDTDHLATREFLRELIGTPKARTEEEDETPEQAFVRNLFTTNE